MSDQAAGALTSGHRFVDQSQVSVDLAGEIANPERSRINFRRATPELKFLALDQITNPT